MPEIYLNLWQMWQKLKKKEIEGFAGYMLEILPK